jgi:hypothetical protein
MHAVCGYPVKSTWLKAVKAGNFVGWPLLTEKNISKYYPETDETPKGHMNQQRKNVRSTKKPFEVCQAAAALRGKKVKDVFVRTYDVRETIFSDQTGQFPTKSKSGNKYIMVMVEIDSNAILVEPMKSRKDAEMIRAYDKLVKRLNAMPTFIHKNTCWTTKYQPTERAHQETTQIQHRISAAAGQSSPQCCQGSNQKLQGTLPQCPRRHCRIISEVFVGSAAAPNRNHTQLTPAIKCNSNCLCLGTSVRSFRL